MAVSKSTATGKNPTRAKSVRNETRAVEDYLEQIYNLIELKGYARVVDIAENLGLAQASVTNMIQRLDGEGYIIYEKYRGLTLTDSGRKVGEAITRRHQLLTRLLRHFSLDEDTIYEDVEGMEHHISRPTLEVISALCEELDASPDLLKKLRKRIKEHGKSYSSD
ncbi:MAG: transcriptional regulator MntR [Verrucomicrobia bacterium]|nr:transcriptional regulator MntR [Verrucomicrobiota bacterium]